MKVLLLCVLLSASSWGQIPVPTEAEQVLALINAQRLQANLPPIATSQALIPLEQAHAEDMAHGRVGFGHDGFALRCHAARVELPGANNCGEIVAWGSKTPDAVVKAWMNSPHHHDAILDPTYNLAGVGISAREDGRRFWGVLFMKR